MIGPLGLSLLALAVIAVGVGGFAVLVDAQGRRSELVTRVGGDRMDLMRNRRQRMDARLRRTRFGARLEQRLRGAAVDVGVSDALLALAAAIVLGVLLMLPLLGVVGSVLLVVGMVMGADRWLDHKVGQRIEAFVAQLPEVARVLSNAASAGLALRSALDLAARELPDPAGAEFRTVRDALALGHSLDEALASMQARLPSRELSVLVQTLVIQSRTGGALVTALQNIALTLEQRKELRREVKTVVSGAVFGGYVVTALGIGSVLVMNLLSPGALDALVGTGVGRVVLVVAGAFFAAGYFLINRMTRIEV